MGAKLSGKEVRPWQQGIVYGDLETTSHHAHSNQGQEALPVCCAG